MTVWFVTRHSGAREWTAQQGFEVDRVVSNLNPEEVRHGDTVIGPLPVHLVAEICARGARYFNINMTVPEEARGKELSAEEMTAFGASLEEFSVIGRGKPVVSSEPSCHVCLVSDQAFANLLPILKRRPKHIELVCTENMRDTGGKRLRRALSRFGYDSKDGFVSTHVISINAATDFYVARQEARRVRESLQEKFPSVRVTLNITGGTKILSSAFFLEFQGHEIIYTDTAADCLRHIDNDQQQADEPLGALIKTMEDYLYCYDYKITHCDSNAEVWRSIACARKNISEKLADMCSNETDIKYIRKLKHYASAVESTVKSKTGPRPYLEMQTTLEKQVPKTPIADFPKTNNPFWKELETMGLLVRRNEKVYFASADARAYFGGKWLEEWVWLQADKLEPDDCAAGVSIFAGERREDEMDDNELDVIVLHHNRLLLIECKTINWRGQNANQDIFNKLDALGTHARGLFGKSWFVSAFSLDKAADRRGRHYGIEAVEGDGLKKLQDRIRQWMGETARP
jgi:putative CRISPR-associated protein (TIGR02620 family)